MIVQTGCVGVKIASVIIMRIVRGVTLSLAYVNLADVFLSSVGSGYISFADFSERYHYGIRKRKLGIVFKASYRYGIAVRLPDYSVSRKGIHIGIQL
jgi:hypothetical protein